MAHSASLSGTKVVQILQHWAAEGNDPLVDIIEGFQQRHDDVRFETEVEHVSSLRLAVKSKVLREEPPDLWDEWPGKNLELAVEADVAADITDLWQRTDMEDAFVSGARDAARFDGRYRCVPMDMYRINNLFFNVDMVERAGVDVAGLGDPEAFLDALAVLDDELDVPPVVVNGRDPYGTLQLWETFLLAHGGGSVYDDLLEGEVARHRGTIERAVESLDRTLEYSPPDVSFLSAAESDAAFAEGEAALTHNGGWSVGRMKTAADFEYGDDWGQVAFPGTEDVFQMNMNALVPAAHTEGDETITAFLEHLATAESLKLAADALGSVPPRNDVPVEALHPVTREHYEALSTTRTQAHSMGHGLGVRPAKVIGLKDAAGTFVRDRDVDTMTRDVVATLSDER